MGVDRVRSNALMVLYLVPKLLVTRYKGDAITFYGYYDYSNFAPDYDYKITTLDIFSRFLNF